MADIRCPMCGKPNPAGSDICQYCQARLTPLIAGTPSEPQIPPSPPPAANTGDWLSDLRSGEAAESSFEEGEAASGSSDFGDWFSRLEEPAAAETGKPAQKPPQPEEEALPNWMSELKETPVPTPGKEEKPDWLHEFQSQAAEETVPGSEKSDKESETAGATDWLAGLGGLSTPEEKEAGQAEPAGTAEPTGVAEPASELPDWMKPESDASRQAAASQEAVPDWMKPEAGVSQPAAASQETVPDWMSEIGGEAATGELYGIEGAETAAPKKSAEPAGFAEPAGSIEPNEFAEPIAEKGEMPEWLKSQMPPASQAGVPDWLSEASTPAAGGEMAETEAKLPESAAEENPADWFAKFGIASEEKPAGATPAFVMSDDEMTPFVSGDEMAAGGAEPSGLETLPDWLSQVPTEQPASETPPAHAAQLPGPDLQAKAGQVEAGQAEAGLAPAQLPTWLEAMRPVESAAPSTAAYIDESGSSIETAGPLAGLRGVLPAEEEISRIRKPPVYSNKLQVSEAHQARVSLLEDLVSAEKKPKPVAPHVAIVPQNALRLAIAVVLILTIFAAQWMGEGYTALPDPSSVSHEVEDLLNHITASPDNAPVLIAFDYDPGFSGEMEASASAAIADLIEKRVPLMLVSTNPLGPALAERLMNEQVNDLNKQVNNLNEQPLPNTSPYTTSQFINLGYIPGGITGLRAFAENPAQIFPGGLKGEEMWTTAPLTSGVTLAGFSLALVITDNPDTARAWIEQAEPVLNPSPLLMIVSAQAEPMIRPYYDTGQVQGLVTGLAGGAAYESKSGRSGLASKYWDAFSLCLLAATILILVGGLVNASLASIAHNKRKGEEQPYA